jgi:hypothetical protein
LKQHIFLPYSKAVQQPGKCHSVRKSENGCVDYQAQSTTPLSTPDGKTTDLGRKVFIALSRLAALQGQIVSHREFEQVAMGLNHAALSRIPLPSLIMAIWCARFPGGQAQSPNWPQDPLAAPALWLSATPGITGSQILLIMAVRGNGGLSYLTEGGKVRELTPEQARLGRLLVLDSKPGTTAIGVNDDASMSSAAILSGIRGFQSTLARMGKKAARRIGRILSSK